jgi:hypothetical protein
MLTLEMLSFRLGCMQLTRESMRISLISPVSQLNNMRANVVVLLYDNHDRAVKLLHLLDHIICDAKVKAILESEKYVLMVETRNNLRSTSVQTYTFFTTG